jgi:hypothetical protein
MQAARLLEKKTSTSDCSRRHPQPADHRASLALAVRGILDKCNDIRQIVAVYVSAYGSIDSFSLRFDPRRGKELCCLQGRIRCIAATARLVFRHRSKIVHLYPATDR